MASSDNVVRAGFTPKYKDINTLTTMLTYNYAPISEQKMSPPPYPHVTLNASAYSSNSSCVLYDPPIEEFAVARTELKAVGAKATFEQLAGPSIFICSKGSGTITVGPKSEKFEAGYVYFVGATAEVILESGSDDFTTFRAFCELSPDANGNAST
jgi:mannose-6-phosphate isomerase